MAKKDKGKRDEREMMAFGRFTRSVAIIPEPKGDFRHVFDDVIEQVKKRNAQKRKSE